MCKNGHRCKTFSEIETRTVHIIHRHGPFFASAKNGAFRSSPSAAAHPLTSFGKQKSKTTYNIDKSLSDMVVSSPSVAYGTENYFAQIMNLLPHLLLSEKSRLLTAVSQSITEEVEAQARTRKSQPMKVNWDDVKIPTEEERSKNMSDFLNYAKSKHFNSNGQKWTREELHER